MATKVDKKPLTTIRQTQLMRVINERFVEFAKRGQPYFSLEGVPTSYITVHVIQDFTTLKEFWPKELITVTRNWNGNQTIYGLNEDTMSKVASAIRSTLDQLIEKGWVERLGNENERRYRPVKEPKKETTKVLYDSDGKEVGIAHLVDAKWVLK